MTDGAHLGIGAKTALGKIIGGKEIPEDSVMSEAEFEAHIRGIDYSDVTVLTYDTSATAIAKMVLDALEKYPVLQTVPTEKVYLRDEDGAVLSPDKDENYGFQKMIPISADLYAVLKLLYGANSIEVEILKDSTGFMWGWAVNAARSILGLGPVPNPAIIEVS